MTVKYPLQQDFGIFNKSLDIACMVIDILHSHNGPVAMFIANHSTALFVHILTEPKYSVKQISKMF